MPPAARDIAYRRVLIKLSGEALMGDAAYGISRDAVASIVDDLRQVQAAGVQLAIVVGGGNLFRGVSEGLAHMDRVKADYMGMLATVMNGLALQDALRQCGVPAHVQSALPIDRVVDGFNRAHAMDHLDANEVVIFVAGTGNPYFTTDTAASLRAAEIQADILIKATKVDGVYSADPMTNPQAKRYDALSYDEVLEKRLGVMDASAIALCRENDLPLRVCRVFDKGNLMRVVNGEDVGTIVR